MLVDTHAHLDMMGDEKEIDTVIHRAVNGGVSRIISVGIDTDSSRAAVRLAREYACVYAAVGCHPHHADACSRSELEELAGMASRREVVAWGEIGLDFYRNYASREAQQRIFEDQLALADELHFPVIIHDREAHEAVYATLKKSGKGKERGVIHCFSGDLSLAEALMDLGYFISIPGTVTYKNASMVKQVASTIPMDRLLMETDAPFLAPVPKRGKRNEPLYVTYTAQEIARLRGISIDELAARTSENAGRLFGLDPGPARGDL